MSKTEVAQFDKRAVSFSALQKQTEANVSLMPKYLEQMKIVDSKKFIRQLVQMKKPGCEVKIQYHYRTGEYFLLVPVEHHHTPTETPKHQVVSIDPGVRTFATCYSPTGGIGKLPTGGEIGLKKRYLRIDRIQSALTKIKSMKMEERRTNGYKTKNINRMNKKIHRLWMEIENSKHHMHYNTIKFLLSNFEKVIVPDFNPHEMSVKQTSILNKGTKRAMFCWGHGEFRQRLKTKASLMGRDGDIIITTEEYTSKTCGCCGQIRWDLGSDKKFECSGCGSKLDRDVNGARNILLKYITEKEGVDVETPQEEMINVERH
uniref:RuvC-like nuclease Rnase H fold n=1 Tax=Clandestinovirus TaxID=2831644 RepID=A0A8F8KNT3_9VIRU|nr:RuvC-like nuclease Rnase H fold [Clandestinovirus]